MSGLILNPYAFDGDSSPATFYELVVADGASHYWALDEGSGSAGADAIGSTDLTHYNSPDVNYSLGGVVTGVDFNSGTDYSQSASNMAFDWTNGCTIECIVEITNSGAGNGNPVWATGTGMGTMRLEHSASGTLRCVVTDSIGGGYTAQVSGLSTGTAYHVVVKYTSSPKQASITVNNGTPQLTGSFGASATPGAQPMMLKKRPWTGAVVGVNFAVSRIAAYSTVLSGTTIGNHYSFLQSELGI